jgi:PAS domain S-box-containing protein
MSALGSPVEERPIEVLHVDDDGSFAELTALQLTRVGREASPEITVETETNPEDALTHVGDVDCLVSDYEMPEMSGLDLLEAVRAQAPDLPFILFTGKGSEEIASRAISAGVTDYIRKGGKTDRFDMLANRVRNACARVRAERAVSRSERHLRRVLDRLPQCVFLKDRDGHYRFVNEAGAASYGRLPEEIEGTAEASVLDDPDLAAQFHTEDTLVLDRDSPLVITEQHVEDGAEARIERVRKFPIELAPTGERMVLGIAEDVTERHRLSEQLETVISELNTVIESLPDDELRAALESIRDTATPPPTVGIPGTDSTADSA